MDGKVKKGALWPNPKFDKDTDIHTYTANIVKDLTESKKHYKSSNMNILRKLSEHMVNALLAFSRCVDKAFTIELLVQRLIRIESYIEKM